MWCNYKDICECDVIIKNVCKCDVIFKDVCKYHVNLKDVCKIMTHLLDMDQIDLETNLILEPVSRQAQWSMDKVQAYLSVIKTINPRLTNDATR